MLRCFVGDKIDVKVLIPVCNVEREKAIALATEMVRLYFFFPFFVDNFLMTVKI